MFHCVPSVEDSVPGVGRYDPQDRHNLHQVGLRAFRIPDSAIFSESEQIF